jgi:hypothetical protein
MKAKELDKNLFPRPAVVKAYETVGQEYERTTQDRVYQQEWLPLVTADPVKNQEIEQKISQLYRIKDSKGKEWLFYDITLHGRDWQGNRKDFYYRDGIIEHMPEFDRKVDPSTNAVIPESTQVHTVKTIYTIPFSKQKVEDLSQYFTESVSCIVVDRSRKRYTCSLQEFTDLDYEELVNLKTGFAEYMNSRLPKQQLKQGGVR